MTDKPNIPRLERRAKHATGQPVHTTVHDETVAPLDGSREAARLVFEQVMAARAARLVKPK